MSISLRTISRYFKAPSDVFKEHPKVSEDGMWVTNGYAAFHREFFDVVPLEKTLRLTKDKPIIPVENIERMYKNIKQVYAKISEVYLNPEDETPIAVLTYLDMQGLHRVTVDARYLGSFCTYLLKTHKKLRISDLKLRMTDTWQNPIVIVYWTSLVVGFVASIKEPVKK